MLANNLKIKVIDYLTTETNAKQWKVLGSGIESNDSIVYRLSSCDYHLDFALKVYHTEKSVKITQHYQSIERFAKSLNVNNSKLRVPEPLYLFLDEKCFLMEWVDGDSLKDTLWKNCFSKKQLQIHIRDAYLWLKYYHQNANLEFKAVDTSRYLSNLKNHIENSNAEDLLDNNHIFKSAFVTLINFEKSFNKIKSYHADLHGDLNLANFIINQNSIFGIDIGGKESLPVEDDLAQMLNYICVNYFNMLTRFDIHKSQDTWEIFNVALDAYDYPKDQESRDFFLFVFLYQMLYRWVSIRKTHRLGKEKTIIFFSLGKWRLYNSSIIVKSLTKLINTKYLDY